MTREELQESRIRGVNDAQKLKESYGELDDSLDEYLISQATSRDSMHNLAKEGNKEALRQETYLKGFLSQWD